MEADWEIEIAPDAPVIDAHWEGFLDLRIHPHAVAGLPEVQQFPALGDALLRLNGVITKDRSKPIASPFWTAKCDLWTPESVDPYEMEASLIQSSVTRACYIDLVPVSAAAFHSWRTLEQTAREVVARLRSIALCCCRADLVLRHAVADRDNGFGVTAYITACGNDFAACNQTLEAALNAFVDAISSFMQA